MSEDIKQRILDFFKSKEKVKTKFYMNDIHKALSDVPKRELKKVINEMINEGTLMYFSTGSTTMVQLAEEDVDAKIK